MAEAGAAGGGTGTSGGAGNNAGSGGASPATCGATPTGTGASFTPVTSYAAKDGGFGPTVTTRNTGDDSLGSDAAGMPNQVAIFRPAAAKYGHDGVTHPIIVWGNGSTNTVDIWQGFLARVATYGFVVVAPEQTQVTADHMNRALDYVLKLANDPASGDCGKIDTTKLGSTGYSLGGAGAVSVGSNARIKSTFIFASNGNVNNLKAPWAVVGGDMDTIFNWTAISAAINGSSQPAFGAALAGIDHNRVAGNAKAQEVYIGWMRWRFMNDTAGHDLFVGTGCKLCSDTAFSGVIKTPTLDSL
jgi:dienelactone hydrolase